MQRCELQASFNLNDDSFPLGVSGAQGKIIYVLVYEGSIILFPHSLRTASDSFG